MTIEEMRDTLITRRGELLKLAEIAGVSSCYVYLVMTGRKKPDSPGAIKIIDAARKRTAEVIAEKKAGRSNAAA